MIGTGLIIVGAIIALIWIFLEIQKLKHKILAVFLIALIVFAYLSFTIVLQEQNIDYSSPADLLGGLRIYFSWLGGLASNFKTMTSHAISLDWQPPEDSVNNVEEK